MCELAYLSRLECAIDLDRYQAPSLPKAFYASCLFLIKYLIEYCFEKFNFTGFAWLVFRHHGKVKLITGAITKNDFELFGLEFLLYVAQG